MTQFLSRQPIFKAPCVTPTIASPKVTQKWGDGELDLSLAFQNHTPLIVPLPQDRTFLIARLSQVFSRAIIDKILNPFLQKSNYIFPSNDSARTSADLSFLYFCELDSLGVTILDGQKQTQRLVQSVLAKFSIPHSPKSHPNGLQMIAEARQNIAKTLADELLDDYLLTSDHPYAINQSQSSMEL